MTHFAQRVVGRPSCWFTWKEGERERVRYKFGIFFVLTFELCFEFFLLDLESFNLRKHYKEVLRVAQQLRIGLRVEI